MSADRLEALTPIPGKDGKSFFRKIGSAWPTANGWSITLDALPLPQLNRDGKIETRILLMPPKESSNEPF